MPRPRYFSPVLSVLLQAWACTCWPKVETPEQLVKVRSLGCDLAQGHYFSKPLSSEAATALLDTYNPMSAGAGSS